jgi:predicted TIM-barrel fold metal-dependent hydrolase
MSPAAALATADLEGSLAEVQRVAALGFRILTLPCKPVWSGHDVEHPNYNLPLFDPLWAAIQDADLAITFHVSTGRDPRASRGNGGAVINYVSHSLSPTIEPVANLCASGVLERFPRLRFATIEAGIGWLPWLLTAMDEAYLKHHFWVRPKLAKHHEGTWPHSAEAIERTMGHLTDSARAKILGLNAAKLFRFTVPQGYVA